MQYTEVASCSTMSPFSSSTRRPSESPNSAASTSDETSSQHQNFVWKPFMGSVVTRKIPKDHCGITSEDFTVTYSNSLRRQLVTVKMQKSLLFEEQRGIWKWFKTWRLPEIRVVVNEQQSFSPSFVRLSVVCPTQRVHVFEEVGLLGRTQAQLVNGECKFTRQRFIATSSSYEGRNFHFFISFFSPTGCCLGALISTGFVVYARGPNTASFQEGIRFSQLMKAQKLWFPPELLMRPFVKKVRSHLFSIELDSQIVFSGTERRRCYRK